MKILVLENDSGEFAFIQKALAGSGTLIQLASSDQAWPYIQAGDARFVIANWDTSDLRATQFIPRARAAKVDAPIYILLITSRETDDDLAPSDADDMLQRPFKPQDLKSRVGIAARILSLAGDLAEAREQLENQAAFDALTGFMNRAAFFRQAMGELERARRASLPLSLITLDVDNFKEINDMFGVGVGDEVLRISSQAIREKSRPYDCIGRWSGDEFLILLVGVIGADAEKITERIMTGINGIGIEVKNGPPLNVKLSAGIVSVTHVGTVTEVEPLIQQSRQAMAHAKESGGNQVFIVFV